VRRSAPILIMSVVLSGLLCSCAKDEVIPIALSKDFMPVSGLRMVVSDFEDVRSDRRRLGIKQSFFGSEDLFQVKDEAPGEAVAKALTKHLTRNGWPVEYVFGSAGNAAGDVVISGTIVELSLDSTRGLFTTEIVAKSKLGIQAVNKNGHAITYTVSGDGRYNVFWFDEADAQELMRDVLESSFDKFVRATTVDATGLRFRQPGDRERPR
jgi:hypothetical protein